MSVVPQFYEREFNGQMRDFVRITVKGMRDVFEAPVRPQDLTRFPDEWQSYKKTKGTKKITGMSLKELPAMSEDRRIELELFGVESIEQLAEADVDKLRNLGQAFVELQRIAELTVKAKTRITGMSLKELPAMSEDRRIELELFGVESIEQLAEANVDKLRNLGQAFVELQRIAELTVKAKTSPKKVHKPLTIGIPDEPIDNLPKRS